MKTKSDSKSQKPKKKPQSGIRRNSPSAEHDQTCCLSDEAQQSGSGSCSSHSVLAAECLLPTVWPLCAWTRTPGECTSAVRPYGEKPVTSLAAQPLRPAAQLQTRKHSSPRLVNQLGHSFPHYIQHAANKINTIKGLHNSLAMLSLAGDVEVRVGDILLCNCKGLGFFAKKKKKTPP